MNIIQDLRFAVRRLVLAPGFTVATIVILSLGIGANSALFTALDRTVLRPLQYPQSDRLVSLWEDFSAFGSPRSRVSPATFIDWQRRSRSFDTMAAYGYRILDLSENGPPEEVSGLGVTASLLPMLGIQPYLGRTIAPAEDAPDVKVVVLSYRLWQRRFNGNPKLIGNQISLSGEKYTVIGVMPKGFQFPNQQSEFWVPLGLTQDLLARRNSHFLRVVGRLKPQLNLQQAQKELDVVAAELAQKYPETNEKVGIVTVPLQDEFVGDRGTTFIILLLAASCVLLIACANVANLLLARASGRRREAAVRTALGASSVRVMMQILVENVLLSLSGGLCGLLVAKWLSSALTAMIPTDLVGVVDLNLDWRTVAFTSAVSLLSGLLFGLVPAIRLSKTNIAQVLNGNARGSVAHSGAWLRDALVIAEIAMALVLVISATLLVETLVRLRSVDAGFETEGILTARINAPLSKYRDAGRRADFYRRIVENVRSIPGVTAVGLTSDLPYTSRGNTMNLSIEGRPLPSLGVDVLFRMISSGYLDTIGAKLIEGRSLRPGDQMESEPVVVVNQTLAQTYWPHENVIGRRIDTGTGDGSQKWMTIVGVVQDIRERGLDLAGKSAVYVPFTQTSISFFMPSEIAVRTSREPLSLSRELQRAVWSVDPEQPVSGVETMQSIVEKDLSGRTQVLQLLGAFAGLALLLAAFGTYCVLSYVVSLRTREIGLRMAICATPSDIAKSVLWYSTKLATCGVAFGLIAAVAATRLLSSLLFNISPVDPSTFAAVSLGLFMVALLAAGVPLAHATRIDPMTALQNE